MTTDAVTTRLHDPLDFEVLADGLGFPEGPVVADDGSVLVVDIDSGRVLRVDARRDDRGRDARAVARTGWLPRSPRRCSWRTTVGSSGRRSTGSASRSTIRRTPTSRPASWAAGSNGSTSSPARSTVLHRECDGRLLRGPNDLVVDEVGGVWFTDHGKGRRASVDRGGLYYIPPGASPGNDAVREVAFPLLGPNGVGLSPDGRRVYVAETHTGRLWAWDLDSPGVVRPAAGSLAVRHGGVCVAATRFSFDSLAVEDGRSDRHRRDRRRHRGDHPRRPRDRRPSDPRRRHDQPRLRRLRRSSCGDHAVALGSPGGGQWPRPGLVVRPGPVRGLTPRGPG